MNEVAHTESSENRPEKINRLRVQSRELIRRLLEVQTELSALELDEHRAFTAQDARSKKRSD